MESVLGEREKPRERKQNSGETNEREGREGETDVKSSNREGNGWTEVRNRKAKGIETNIYVSNLPRGFNSTKLWRAFSFIEGLSDAFVPMKKNEIGRVFGFLLFKKVNNEASLLKKITSEKLEGTWIQANISRYARDPKADFRRGEERKHNLNGGWNTKRIQQINLHTNGWRSNNVTGGRSFRDVVQGTNNSSNMNEVVVNLGFKRVTGLVNLIGRSFVAETKDLETMEKLAGELEKSTPVHTCMRYLGGLKVLLSFFNKEEAQIFFEAKDEVWSKWFINMSPWLGIDGPRDRIVRIALKGIPIQSWSIYTSELIGSKFGRVLAESLADRNDGDLSVDKIIVLVKNFDRIKSRIKLVHMGKVAEILVGEEVWSWSPKLFTDKDREKAEDDKNLPESETGRSSGECDRKSSLEGNGAVGIPDSEVSTSKKAFRFPMNGESNK